MRLLASLLLFPGLFGLAGCGSGGTRGSAPPPAPASRLYEDVSNRAGLQFRFENGARGRHQFIETTGSGCAFFDYDADGLPDLFYVQSGPLPWDRPRAAEVRNRLYRNNGDGTFTDVTAGSGLEDTGYGQGVAVGDVNADGYDDLFITAYGANHLFLNRRGTGKFTDATRKAGLGGDERGARWSTSAAFGDYDGDGKLDLYVCRYVKWSQKLQVPCTNARGESSYCSPELFQAEEHGLYHNNGDGTFTDVSARSGIARLRGRGLGVAWLDFDQDGKEDLFVANDLDPFFLWKNNGNGTFTNVGDRAGVAYNDQGQVLSGMGVGVRDYDGDGREDLFVTNFSGQMYALYRSGERGIFTNTTLPSGVGAASFNRLAFGCEFLDFNRDGLPDLLVGNGHVNEDISAYAEGITYAQPKTLLQNRGDGTFTEVKDGLGSLAVPRVTRGLAVADFDRDGHLDVATNNQDGSPELLRYTGPSQGHWIAIDTRGTRSNPNGFHARVTVRAGGKTQTAEVRSGSSFCSHSESRLYFGIGEATTAEEVRITWHGSRAATTAMSVAADRAYRAVEGKGLLPVPEPPRKAGTP